MEIFQYGLLALLPTTIVVLFFTYLGCKVLDMILGILKTYKNGGYRSRKMRDGIIRWIAEIVAIVFVIMIDCVLGLNFLLCGFTISLFIYKEGGSILENLSECGVELHSAVAEKLEIFNKSNKNQD